MADMTTFDPLLKEHYDGQTVANLVYKNNPFLAMVPKKEDFGGRNMPLPLIYGNPQNRSASFAQAVAGTSATKAEAFTLTRVKNYAVAFVDGETLKASKGDQNAFIEALTTEIDGAMQALANDIAFSLTRDSSGARAQVYAEPSEAATTVITLKSAEDVVGFEVGQNIEIYSAKSGGSQRTYDGTVTAALISAVNRSATTATITINTTYSSSGSIAANDYIFVKGDRGAKASGLGTWVPTTAPSDSLFGVDRSVDPTRLGGVRVNGTGMPIEEALIMAAQECARNGGKPDVALVSFTDYAKLLKSLGSNVQYIDTSVTAEVSFRGVLVHGAHGPINVMPDRTVPASVAWLLQMDTWVLASVGPLVQLLDDDGNRILRQASADGYEIRVGSYYQLGCKAPGHNAVVTLD